MRILYMFAILGAFKKGLSIQPLPIIFDRTPVNVTVIAGNTAVLPCIVNNKGQHQIIWMSPRKMIISEMDRLFLDDMRMSIERPCVQNWNLHIRTVELKDNGTYTCLVNTNPVQNKMIHLTILGTNSKSTAENSPVSAVIQLDWFKTSVIIVTVILSMWLENRAELKGMRETQLNSNPVTMLECHRK